MDIYGRKEIIVFDLDGTLAKSKEVVDDEMAKLLSKLLKIKKVAVMSGGTYLQMEKEVVSKIDSDKNLFYNLFLFPKSASSFYAYTRNGWKNIYKEGLSKDQRTAIIDALKESLIEAGYEQPSIVYGEIIEDRETQITFSGLGQKAPLEEKLKWDPDRKLREKIIKSFERRLPNFDAKVGGSTSIDINIEGIDKAYGIKQIENKLDIPIEKILFIGDALFVGGNDYPVVSTGVDTIAVSGPEETKKYIRDIIA